MIYEAIKDRLVNNPNPISDHELLSIGSHITRSFYTLDCKPQFEYGECVEVDTSKWNVGGNIENARIVGKSVDGVIDIWLCEFNHDFAPTYPYRVVGVQHTFIRKYDLPTHIVRLDDGEVFVKNENNRYELALMQEYKRNGHHIHEYSVHTLMVVHKGKFIDQVIFDLLRQYRPQDLQKLVVLSGGAWTV